MSGQGPSRHEMRARMGFAGSIVIGLGVAAAMNAATHDMAISVAVGVGIAIVLMVVFTGAFRRRRRPHDDEDAGSTDSDDAR